MRAVRFHEYGGVDNLVVEQAPDPHPGPREIRVRVAAANVKPIDWKLRAALCARSFRWSCLPFPVVTPLAWSTRSVTTWRE